jgi:hypothetical protein
LGDELTLSSINLTLSVEDIYDRVQNGDVKEWLENQEKQQTNANTNITI